MIRASLFFVLATVALGCAEAVAPAGACEAPAEVTLTFASGELLNPDEGGAPLPTELRVHEVREFAPFENAAFDDAWQPGPGLAASIVSTQTLTLYPGETARVALAPSPDAIALVAVAIVRRPAGRTWRAIVPMQPAACGAQGGFAFRVDEYRIERATETP